MRRYFFTLRDDGPGYSDPTGVELPHDQAALDYARLIAAELMRHREQETRHWCIDVKNDAGTKIGSMNFATVDWAASAIVTQGKT